MGKLVLSPKVNSDESLGRFLTQKNHFSRNRDEVKFNAFVPPSNLRLSVYRVEGLNLDKIWGIGQKVVDTIPEPRTLYGVADIKARVVERESLKIIPDKLPCRHADIINWPSEDARQLSIAQKLAAESRLILKT